MLERATQRRDSAASLPLADQVHEAPAAFGLLSWGYRPSPRLVGALVFYEPLTFLWSIRKSSFHLRGEKTPGERMTKDQDVYQIKERPEHQRFWVVRSSGGQYIQHFRRGGVAAIGHLNELELTNGPVGADFALSVEKALTNAQPSRSKGSITSHANQVKSLVSEMKEHDIVLTLDSSHLMVGIIGAKPAYISDKPIVIMGRHGEDWEMRNLLRREVTWGPTLSRHAVPAALELTLFAHQAVFNIDEHWASIYHLLYPCFRYGQQLYLSANIEQTAQINNYAVSQFFSLLSGIEIVGAALADWSDKSTANDSYDFSYEALFNQYRRSHSFSLTTRAEFMSPGTAWSTATMGTQRMAWTALIYVMLFGGDMIVIKTDGLITKEMREKAWSLVLEMKDKHDFPTITNELRLDIPRIDTRPLDANDVRTA